MFRNEICVEGKEEMKRLSNVSRDLVVLREFGFTLGLRSGNVGKSQCFLHKVLLSVVIRYLG